MPVSKGTILVVDDEKGVLNLASAILKAEGYEVLVNDSGYGAFTMLEKRVQTLGEVKVDLVIVDWRMNGWDGMKVLSEIRQRPYGTVPVILMSGAVTREELVNAAKNKADSVLVKPLDKTSLVNKVTEVLTRVRGPSTPK